MSPEKPTDVDRSNPQAKEMADESMVRTLTAQANAIWPQEAPLFARYDLPDNAEILDAGCGTGEITPRLTELFPNARVLGVDVLPGHLDLARTRATARGLDGRVRFEQRSVFDLGLPSGSFDLAVCRHVLHAIPHPERVLAELTRVVRPGGWLHVLAEDYGMLHFEPRTLDADPFWSVGTTSFGKATGTDFHIGRKTYRVLSELGLRNLTVDYAIVDTVRVPRATFAAIWEAWRDGFADAFAEHTPLSKAAFLAHFEDMLATIRDPDGYGVWMSPIVSGQLPVS